MDLEHIFSSALLVLGPPLEMPRITRDGIPTPIGKFNTSVMEYYNFLEALGVVTDEACSYSSFSEWFHDRR